MSGRGALGRHPRDGGQILETDSRCSNTDRASGGGVMSVPINKYLAQIRYVFPFRLSLPDKAFWLDFRGSATFVRVSSGRALRTLVLRPAAQREETKERYWLKATAAPDDITNREMCINPTSDLFVEEVRDTVGFCRMDVMFERPGQPPGANAPELSEIRESAMERAQLFIRTYRVVADEVDVSTPREADSPLVEVGVSTRYLINGKGIEGQFSLVQREFCLTAPELTGLLKPVLAHDKVLSFSQQLDQRCSTSCSSRQSSCPIFTEIIDSASSLHRPASRHMSSGYSCRKQVFVDCPLYGPGGVKKQVQMRQSPTETCGAISSVTTRRCLPVVA